MRFFSPLEHFEINIFAYFYNKFYDFSLNSGSVYLLSLVFFLFFTYFLTRKSPAISTKANLVLVGVFDFILSVFKQQVASARALRFFPFIFVLFFYITILNLSSLFVFGVSLTGHILITAYLSSSIFLSLLLIGLLNFGRGFFKFFVPAGVPKVLLDFIILIEVFSFAIRPFSLAIRLFANMLAGHTLMGILSQSRSFVVQNYFFLFILPLTLVVLVFLLEIAVSIIQAYIFVSPVCIYLNDVYNLH